ncbi:MAG: protein kinase [Myxococcales bacterium]|nr:protein kinase [Myxococcales bacterium]
MEEAQVGCTIDGRFTLLREISRGGMGAVFEAEHPLLATTVAIKLLVAENLRQPAIVQRLFREAKALAAVRGRGVVQVLDAGLDATYGPYIVMEMLRGRSLDGVLAARTRMSLAETVQLVHRLGSTLSWVHRRGVVHRDLKPSNVLLVPEGDETAVKLIDFGISILPDHAQLERLTAPGLICGTIEYMAPEQLLGGRCDKSCDIFSLGVIAFECISGGLPFGSDIASRISAHSMRQSAPLLNLLSNSCSVSVARVIDRALALDPAARYSDALDFAEALAKSVANSIARPAAERTVAAVNTKGMSVEQPAAPTPPMTTDDVAVVNPTELVLDLVRRRRHARAPYLTPVRVVDTARGVDIDGRSQDVSASGIQILLTESLPIGSRVILRFASPISGRLVAASAVVRWCGERRNARFPVGFEFETEIEARDDIQRYIEWFGTKSD